MQHILAFGDSFSDNGFSNGCGYNRLSNGKVWVEYLAELLNASLEDRAWCGATSSQGNASGPENWSGLAWQVETYKPHNNGTDILCTILIGINDVYEGNSSAENVVVNIVSAIEDLADKGIKRFLVSNVPDITHAPAYGKEYAPAKERVQDTIKQLNSQLERALFYTGGLSIRRPDIELFPLLDAYTVFNKLVSDKKFTNTHEPWNDTYSYPHPYSYIWWDAWHPMTEAHRVLALAAVEVLESEPGPNSKNEKHTGRSEFNSNFQLLEKI